MHGSVRIGTSGWHYKHWLGLFYPRELPAKDMMQFYAQHFDTVEINNSFYRLPTAKAFDSWRENSPPNFLFALKGSRFITHMKKLKDPEIATTKFFMGAERLHEKLGPILFQLPPNWRVDLERLSGFLNALPKEHRYAFEFRDVSWLIPDVYELLREHDTAFCIHDLAGQQSPIEVTASFTYVRFHGPSSAKYAGSYTISALRQWADRIKVWRKKLAIVYVYFNNDIGGHAAKNALELKKLCE